jgi:hypothetical protein
VQCLALKHDAALARSQQAQYGMQGCGLASTIGAQQGDNLSLVDLQRDVPQRLYITVKDRQMLYVQHCWYVS